MVVEGSWDVKRENPLVGSKNGFGVTVDVSDKVGIDLGRRAAGGGGVRGTDGGAPPPYAKKVIPL